jgi:hypothetical protein
MAADETESPSNEDVTDDPSSSTGLGPIGSTSVKDVEAVAGDRAATFLSFRLNHRRGGLLLELLGGEDGNAEEDVEEAGLGGSVLGGGGGHSSDMTRK